MAAAGQSTSIVCGTILARLAGRGAPGRYRRGEIAFYEDPWTLIGREKRRSPRYPSSRKIWLRWRDWGRDSGQAGELVDISINGALAILPGRLRVGRRVVVSLGEDHPVRVKAVVWAVEEGKSCFRVRLAFSRPCPEAILEAAIDEQLSLPGVAGRGPRPGEAWGPV